MPTLLRDCSERRHVHVTGGGRGEAKYWLEPLVERAASRGYTGREMARIERQIASIAEP